MYLHTVAQCITYQISQPQAHLDAHTRKHYHGKQVSCPVVRSWIGHWESRTVRELERWYSTTGGLALEMIIIMRGEIRLYKCRTGSSTLVKPTFSIQCKQLQPLGTNW